MTKCHKCGAEQKTDSVDTIGAIAIIIAVFSFGYLIRHNYMINDLFWDLFGFGNLVLISRIMVVIMWGSFAFFILAVGIKWLER